MRGFSALYFYLRIGIYFVAAVFAQLLKENHSIWFSTGLTSLSIALTIVVIRPYKRNYMNYVDTLLLMNYALLCFAMAPNSNIRDGLVRFLIETPAIIFILVILLRILWQISKLKWKLLQRCCKCCQFRTSHDSSTFIPTEAEQPLIEPTSTEIVID